MSKIISFFFARMSTARQASLMRRFGIMLGTRKRNGQQIYTYMFRNLFVEIIYKDNNPDGAIDHLFWVTGLKNLNSHLENEIRSRVK